MLIIDIKLRYVPSEMLAKDFFELLRSSTSIAGSSNSKDLIDYGGLMSQLQKTKDYLSKKYEITMTRDEVVKELQLDPGEMNKHFGAKKIIKISDVAKVAVKL